ncbi:MAG: type II toxin-antitoxin system antitoxin SocA domain-containing protein [Pseudomonadota bacterium]
METKNVFDIAAFIVSQKHPLPTPRLHKLLYYCQAWSLVWDEKSLFEQPIEAWASGPVIKELYEAHKGQYELDLLDVPKLGNPDALSDTEKETVQVVLRDYGNKSAQWLRDLITMEKPWIDARKGLDAMQEGGREITLVSMAEYYEGVYNEGFEIET